MSDNDKCAVKTCPNRKGEGAFDGPICLPCLDAIGGQGSGPAIHRVIESALARIPR